MNKRLVVALVLIIAFTMLTGCSLLAKEYTIEFDSVGGTSVNDITAKEGERIHSPEPPTKDGYVFAGWYKDKEYNHRYKFGVMGDKDITLYAKWETDGVPTYEEHTITFDSMGGSAVSDIVAVEGQSIAAPIPPTKEGYTFGGWYEDRACTMAFEFGFMRDSDIKLYAKWIEDVKEEYTITFDSMGGSSVADIVAIEGAPIVAPTNPTKSGYVFVAWYTDRHCTNAFVFSKMPSENITLYAKWQLELLGEGSVVLHGNGGLGTNMTYYKEGEEVALPTDWTKVGYTFAGWYTDEEFINKKETISIEDRGVIHLYAKYNINTYTISFETNGGNIIDAINVEYQGAITLPTPTFGLKHFAGWFEDSGFTKLFEETVMPANNITLYAKWVDGYRVAFSSFGVIINEQFLESNTYTLPTLLGTEFDNIDYEFLGWYEDELFTKKCASTVDINSDMTFYAKWKHKSFMPYKTTFDNSVKNRTPININNSDELINLIDYVMVYDIRQDVKFKLNYISGESNKQKEIIDVYQNRLTATGWPRISYVVEAGGGISSICVAGEVYSNGEYKDTANQNSALLPQLDNLMTEKYIPLRSATFDDFAYKGYREKIEVSESDEMFYMLEHGIAPLPKPGSNAERLLNEAKMILRSICDGSMTNLEKIKAIYDWAVDNIYYDFDAFNSFSTPVQAMPYEAWHMDGVLLTNSSYPNRAAVCDGISKAITVLARIEGIPTVRVISDNHAWNKVYLDLVGDDGICEWYGLDATWGNGHVNLNNLSSTTPNTETYSAIDFLFTDAYKESEGQIDKNYLEYDAVTDVDVYKVMTFEYDGVVYDYVIDDKAEVVALAEYIHKNANDRNISGQAVIDVKGNYSPLFSSFQNALNDELVKINNRSASDVDVKFHKAFGSGGGGNCITIVFNVA